MTPTIRNRKRMTLIHDLSKIPEFKNETEEHSFWETHAFSDALLAKVQPEDEPTLELPPRRKTDSKSITLRLDTDSVKRLKVLAHEKEIPYQTLLKRFVTERLYEEEKRAGLIDAKRDTPPRAS